MIGLNQGFAIMRGKLKTVDIFQGFDRNSIFLKYFKKTAEIVLIPFLILELVICLYASNANKHHVDLMNSLSFVKSCQTMKSVFDSIVKQEYALMSNNSIISMIASEDAPENSHNIQNQLMLNSVATSPYIESVDIYSTVSDYVFSTGTTGWIEDFRYLPWYEPYAKTGNTNFVIPTKSNPKKAHYDRLSFAQGIYYNKKLYGIVVCNIKIDELVEYINANDMVEDVFYIVDSEGVILYSNAYDTINQKFSRFDRFTESEHNFLVLNSKKQTFYRSALPIMNLSFVTRIDRSSANYPNKVNIPLVLLLSFLVMILMISVMSFYLSHQFYRSIADILKYLQPEFHYDGDTKENESNNEIGFIKNSISGMISANKEFEKQLGENLVLLKKTQSAMLQLQFNPHFLFNTLNMASMKAIAMTRSENDVSSIIKLVSELMRKSLSTDSYFTTVEEELEFAEKYLEIEGIRYNHDFDVDWDIDESVLGQKVVKLVLQPIIENAFSHGLRKLPPDIRKCIGIAAFREGETLVLRVTDNGVADEKELKKISAALRKGELPQSDHIGLRNVNSRIKLLYEDEYGCTISREHDQTVVRITFPMI